MFQPPKKTAAMRRSRRGTITVLVAVSIVMLLGLTAYALNVAYMQLVRQQLRVACDSAAKAALVNYGANQSQSTARTFARTVSGNNLVAGQSVTFSDANIEFGNATKNGSGVYAFTPNSTPLNMHE